MRSNLHRFLLYCLIFILQIILDYYVNLGPYIYLCLLPLIILLIPMDSSPVKVMTASFAFGLLLDVMADGVLGLNAASAVMLAAFRKPLFDYFLNTDRLKKNELPSVKSAGIIQYSKFISICVCIYLSVYIFADCISVRPALFIMIRLISSIIVNGVTIMVISYSIIDKD